MLVLGSAKSIDNKSFSEEGIMKKLTLIGTGLLLFSGNPVFAEEHFVAVQEHVNAAIVHGGAGHTRVLREHAKAALAHALEASIVAKGMSKSHLDAAAKELQESLDLVNLGHVGAATIHVEAAEKHIKASEK